MAEHKLKCWPFYFDAVKKGEKTFELRKHDRDFQPGDILKLNEFKPKSNLYTGRHCYVLVTYVMTGPWGGLAEGWCILGIHKTSADESEIPMLLENWHDAPGENP